MAVSYMNQFCDKAMLKGKDVINNSIIVGESLEQVGTIKDIIVDSEARNVIGFLVRKGGWAGGAQILPYTEVVGVSNRRAVAISTTSVVKADAIPWIRNTLERGRRFRQSPVRTPEQQELGTLTDIYFDSQAGEIMGYEVTAGLSDDLNATGQTFVPAGDEPLIVKDDAIIVPQATLNKMKVNNFQSQDEHQAAEIPSLTKLLGRRVRWAVRGPEGEIIAAQGQIVTQATAEQARANHRENDLLRAVDS